MGGQDKKLFLTVEKQLIHVKGMREPANHIQSTTGIIAKPRSTNEGNISEQKFKEKPDICMALKYRLPNI